MKDLEHKIQSAYFDWARLVVNTHPELELLHATPNGGKRSITTAVKLKKEGVKAGEPDVKLGVARGAFIGLAIEFKAGDNNPSAEQRRRIDLYQKQGWCVVICWSTEAAISQTTGYLRMMKIER